MTSGDWGWTGNGRVWIPEVRITEDDPSYVLVPLRGYCALLAVFSIDDHCIGWIGIDDLGYETVKDWMRATNWRDGGY